MKKTTKAIFPINLFHFANTLSKLIRRPRTFINWRFAVLMMFLIALAVGSGLITGRGSRNALASTRTSDDGLWQDVNESLLGPVGQRRIIPDQYRTLRLDLTSMKAKLDQAPLEFTEEARGREVVINVPLPDGSFGRFRLSESHMLEPSLAEQFPDIKNYFGSGIDDPTATIGVVLEPSGFHAYLLTAEGAVSVDPYADGNTSTYISYYKIYDPRERGSHCEVTEALDPAAEQARLATPQGNYETGRKLHTYRLAVAATGEYTQNHGGTVESALAAIAVKITAVNVIFRRDVSITFVLVNSVAVIYTNPSTDPYTDNNLNNLIDENQLSLPSIIGNANFDVSQVFAWTSGGGLAALASVCDNLRKANATSGGDGVVLFAHEMGHQFSASHTFNDGTNASCGSFNGGNQRNADTAFEPGSGSTIMSYCGTCGAGDLQPQRDPYFLAFNIIQMRSFTGSDETESLCGTTTVLPNTPPHIVSLPSLENEIPILTPFVLQANVTDAEGNALTYMWEQRDAGAASPPEADGGDRAIFRSYTPGASATRYFPSLNYILNNANTPPPTYNGGCSGQCVTGELEPTTSRRMQYLFIVRDGQGAMALNGDTIKVTTHSEAGPFLVTQPNTGVVWTQGAPRAITWAVNNTNMPPVNCANVRISLSTDAGQTFPFVLADSTPNDGSETVNMPFVVSSTARLKIEAVGNIFFDISDANFTVGPLTVTTNADNGDNVSPVQGSLRQAIIDANNIGGLDTISFAAGAGTMSINPVTPLPAITDPVIIDGWSRGGPGYDGPPLVSLNGVSAGANAEGLHISGGGSTVRGLSITSFSSHAIVLQTNGNNAIYGNYLGLNTVGGMNSNGGFGIYIVGTPNNRIGGNNPQSENLIGGNNTGIVISGSTATGNQIQRNFIGTNVNGSDLGNTLQGISIIDAPNNSISGCDVSGNGGEGIRIAGAQATGNIIGLTSIGLSPSADVAVFNGGAGVRVINAPNTVIGSPAGGNTISGNHGGGISIEGAGSFGTKIQSNNIGTSVLGNIAIPNTSFNVYLESANNLVGGPTTNERNLISGGATGIAVGFSGATGNTIVGNYIGTNASGQGGLNPNSNGIEVRAASGNQIGGTAPGTGNVISGNAVAVFLVGGANNNQVQGNLIGTNPSGNAGAGNRFQGVVIEGANGNLIGGSTAGAGNVISGNSSLGTTSAITLSSSSNNTIQGNRIGTNAAGTVSIGNNGNGIVIAGPEASNNNLIGGATAGARNIIAGSFGNGIRIVGNGNIVRGNYIGTDITGQLNFGNGKIGVEINGSDNNQVGGGAAGEGNLIAFNGVSDLNNGDGVRITSATVDGITHGVGNRIRGNSIHSNRRLGIDLLGGTETGGVTANDGCDGDGGFGAPNNLQNFPVITAATSTGGSTTVAGALNSTSNATYTIDVFANASCSASGNGEGKTYLGSTTVNTGAGCTGNINAVLPVQLAAGSVITATATDAAGNSSEFSACFAATVIAPAGHTVSDFDGDGKTDVSVFRPSTGTWYSNRSQTGFSANQFGTNGDKLVPADYDGDGKTDLAVWRPAAGVWYLITSSNGVFSSIQFGQTGDMPLPGDNDGDGKADISVFRPSTGTFYMLQSSNGSFRYQQWGANGDVPLLGDYDGDHKTDFAVFRPSAGAFYILQSSNGVVRSQQFGQNGDKAIAGDVDGDGKTDLCVFRPAGGGWYTLNSSDGSFHGTAWGSNGDLTAAGDYDGDGRMDIAIYRAATGVFYILQTSNAALKAEQFGIAEDIPVTSAYVP